MSDIVTLTRQEIVDRVRTLIDDNMVGESAIDDFESKNIDKLIVSLVIQAATAVYQVAAPRRFGAAYTLPVNGKLTRDYGNRHGWLHLPDDFLRMLSFKMESWSRPLYTFYPENDMRYELQFREGVRGSIKRPIAFVTRQLHTGGYQLEFFGISKLQGNKDDDVVANGAKYVKRPTFKNDDSIDIFTELVDAVIMQTAGLTFITIGEPQRGEPLLQLSKLNSI